MVLATTSLTGFSGETIWSLGQLRLLVTIRDADHDTKAWMNFMIVRSLSPYNGIIGRPRIRDIQAVPSTAHGMLKFPVDEGIVTLHSNFPDQEVAIGGTLSAKGRTELCSLLKENLDIFAWQPSDMTGAPERAKAIQAEVQKLVEAGIMREVYYHDWLPNPVMVKKHDGSWRMCVDFTDLNKACPQDCYPFLKLTEKSNLSAATPLSVSWTLTKAITRYRWQSQMKRKRLSTPAKRHIVIPKCSSASKTLAPHTSGWWTKLLTTKLVGT
ncbi:hypothetical protein Tco_1471632 [Tanacetum coccineum]